MKHSNFKTNVHNLVLAAMFLALALVLPFLTGQIPQIGGMLLPMHLPVFLCGLICGWQYGAVVGFVAPLMRMALFGMPPLVAAVAMAFELAAYGGIAGFLYNRSRWQCVVALYRALLAAMVGSRIVWAAVRVVMTGVASVPFTWQIFLTEALVNAIPGIILQLVFIPVLMVALDRTGMVRFRREQILLLDRHAKARAFDPRRDRGEIGHALVIGDERRRGGVVHCRALHARQLFQRAVQPRHARGALHVQNPQRDVFHLLRPQVKRGAHSRRSPSKIIRPLRPLPAGSA